MDENNIEELTQRFRDTKIDDNQTKCKKKIVPNVFGALKLANTPENSINKRKGRRKINLAKINAIRRKLFEDTSTDDSSPSKQSDDELLPLRRKRGRKICVVSSDKWKKRRLAVRENEERRRQKKSQPCPSHAVESTTSIELEPRENLLFPDSEESDCLMYTSPSQLPFLYRNHPNVAFRQARTIATRRHLRPKRSHPPPSKISKILSFEILSDSDYENNANDYYRHLPIPDELKISKAATEHETSDS